MMNDFAQLFVCMLHFCACYVLHYAYLSRYKICLNCNMLLLSRVSMQCMPSVILFYHICLPVCLSACLSVQPMLLYLNVWTYHGFNDLVGVSLIFEPHCCYKIPMRTPYRGVIYMGWKKIVIFDGNHCLSWRWYEIGPGYYGWRNQKS